MSKHTMTTFWVLACAFFCLCSSLVSAQELELFGTNNFPFTCSSITARTNSVTIEFSIFEKRRKAYRVGNSDIFFTWFQDKTTKTLCLPLSNVKITNLDGDQELNIENAITSIEAGRPVLLLCFHEQILPLFKNAIRDEAIVIRYKPQFLQ